MHRFDNMAFTKSCLDEANAPLMASHLTRKAIDEGAHGDIAHIQSNIRKALECYASMSEYKRIRVEGVKGYQYVKKVSV